MSAEKGRCRHGEFILSEGCSLCIAESRGDWTNPVWEHKMDEIPFEVTDEVINREDKVITDVKFTVKEDSALIKIKPNLDEAVVRLYQESCRLLDFAQARTIKIDDDVKLATNDLSIIAKFKKAIEEKRKEYTGPINDHLKAVNKAFQDFTAPLIEADTITQQKVKDYRTEQERVRQEQERINQLRFEAAQAEMALKGEVTEPVNLVEVAPAPAEHYRTEMGTLGTIKVRKWQVENFEMIPREYMMLDSVKIGKVVRAGIPNIPGIRIWIEKGLRVTPK